MILEIDKAFTTNGYTVFDFFQRPGMGLYIPLYQREYSWDSDNINQLIEDVTRGIEALCDKETNELRFLGTIITIVQADKTKIDPIDTKAVPTAVEYIIDGQQRLTTLALFALILYDVIEIQNAKFRKKVKDEKLIEEIDEACSLWQKKLLNIFSLDLGKGLVHRKPQIIRGQLDRWVKDGDIESNYKSDLANLLGNFLNFYFLKVGRPEKPIPRKDNNVTKNYQIIRRWIENYVMKAHVSEMTEFTEAKKLIVNIKEEYIWDNDRKELKDIVLDSSHQYCDLLSCFVQLFSVCHYILDRCCFTHIVPVDEDWAFDMFQSLNASGTPLTAIETFKPLVVNSAETYQVEYKNSELSKSFEKIEQLFVGLNTAASKLKRTNELITSFRIIIDGKKIENHFSTQRKWLNNIFSKLYPFEDKEKYLRLFGYYSEFLNKYWLCDNKLDFLNESEQEDLTEILFRFLKESKHNMAITIIGRLYAQLKQGESNSIPDFIKGIKLVSGFYCFYRSLQSNAGLDDVYRKYFEENKELEWQPKGWIKQQRFDVDDFNMYLLKFIEKRFSEYTSLDSYKSKAVQFLKYTNSKSICRLAMFVSSHDTIPDSDNLGLIKIGVKDSCRFLTLGHWTSEKLSTLEHIAPQTNTEGWDEDLYTETAYFDSVGNLTLLPTSINASIGNRTWKEKFIYYRYLTEKDKEKYQEIRNFAIDREINLNPSILEKLEGSPYYQHIENIIAVGFDGSWDYSLVKNRAQVIAYVFGDFIFKLLNIK